MRRTTWGRLAAAVEPAFAWRFAALGGIAAGLALSPLAAHGTLRSAPSWESSWLARYGIREVLAASRIHPTGARRGGLPGAVDAIRDRAAAALDRGTSPSAAALLRGFVLGEADRIAPET